MSRAQLVASDAAVLPAPGGVTMFPSPDAAVERMTGSDIVAVLRQCIEDERTVCVKLAEGMAESYRRSGKEDEAMACLRIAAAIKERSK